MGGGEKNSETLKTKPTAISRDGCRYPNLYKKRNRAVHFPRPETSHHRSPHFLKSQPTSRPHFPTEHSPSLCQKQRARNRCRIPSLDFGPPAFPAVVLPLEAKEEPHLLSIFLDTSGRPLSLWSQKPEPPPEHHLPVFSLFFSQTSPSQRRFPPSLFWSKTRENEDLLSAIAVSPYFLSSSSPSRAAATFPPFALEKQKREPRQPRSSSSPTHVSDHGRPADEPLNRSLSQQQRSVPWVDLPRVSSSRVPTRHQPQQLLLRSATI